MRNSRACFLQVSPFTFRRAVQFLSKAKDLVCSAVVAVLFFVGVHVLAVALFQTGIEQGVW